MGLTQPSTTENQANSVNSVDPRSGRSLGEFVPHLPEDVPNLVAKARNAWQDWSALSFKTRREVMKSAYHRFNEARDEIALLIAQETGKPLAEAYSSEILPTLDCFKYHLKHAHRILKKQAVGASNPLLKVRKGYVRYEPLGVVAVITPWNYPLLLGMQHIIPALLSGNVVIHKPSENTTLTGLKIGEIFSKAFLPQNVLTILTGFADVGRALVAAQIDKVFFTGSTSVGRKIYQSAAEHLRPVNMELGGSDPMVVLEDADLERAANAAVWGAFCNAGQTCVSIERLYVHANIFEAFVTKLVEKVGRLRPSRDDLSDGEIASLNNQDQFDKVQSLVEDALMKGAEVRIGGQPRRENGMFFFEPTVLTEIDASMRIANEEIFGPVVSVTPFNSEREAIALANNSEFGLSASVWTRDNKHGEKLASEIQAGAVLVNEVLTHLAQFEAPYTAYKHSGIGVSHGPWGLLEMVHPKYISSERKIVRTLLDAIFAPLARRDVWWFKYDKHVVNDFRAFADFLHAPGIWRKLKSVPRALKALLRESDL